MSPSIVRYLRFEFNNIIYSRDSLSNGHHLNDSSPNAAPLTGNSTQATSIDDVDCTEVNDIDAPVAKANVIPNKLNSHYSVSGEGEAPPIATPDPSHDLPVDLPTEGADELSLGSTSLLPQQPTSDLREEPQPATLEQTSEIKKQNQSADIAREPELANRLLSDRPQATEFPAMIVPGPVTSASEVKPESTPSTQDPTQDPAALEPSITTTEVPHNPPVPLPDDKLPEEPLDPAPSPVQAMSNGDGDSTSLDPEVPADLQPPSKMSRPREDDGDEAPAAKRSRVEGETPPVSDVSTNTDFKTPAQPGHGSVADVPTAPQTPSKPAEPITIAQKRHMIKAIQNTKRSNDAKPFLVPVDIVALKIPNYPNFVKIPMDLKTMEEKLKSDQYASVQEFKSDFEQIILNAVAFNGVDHVISKNGYAMAKTFERGMTNLPGPDVQAPAPADKKSRKTSLPMGNQAGPLRREPRTSLPVATAPSPVTTESPTFALNPNGIPLIRRDSTKGDGRPKREIHPPAPRDLPYAHSKPKKKKYQAELRFCLHVLNELNKTRYAAVTGPFQTPVDPIALNIPDYLKIIKKPMDLSTVRAKLENGQYENAHEFDKDMRLIFANCIKYNKDKHPVSILAGQLEGYYVEEMGHKRSWIDANSPVPGPHSTASSDDEDDEDDEEDDEAEEEVDEDQLTILQRSIAQMSEQVRMLQQKKKSPPAASKKAGKGGKSDKKIAKKAAPTKPAKQEKKAPVKHSRKEQYVTYEQKQDISNRINSLSEPKMAKALKIIRDNMPSLKVRYKSPPDSQISVDSGLTSDRAQGVQDDELELDIDELSDDVLRKLHDFVRRNSKGEEEVPRPPPVVTAAPAPARKKNKPMSKQEQERQIQDLKNVDSRFQNPTLSIENAPDACKFPAHGLGTPPSSDGSSDAVHNDTSGDEDDSEESEEE